VRDAQPVTVLGIDPGTAVTGYGIVRKEGRNPLTLVECGVIRTRPRDDLSQRLVEIHDGIVELIRRHKPTVLSIEDIFYARNVRTTVVLGHARGVIMLAAAHAGLEIHEYPRLQKAVLKDRQCLTVEPGLYYPGLGGVRHEDVVVVTEIGCKVLSRFPKQLEI